MIGCDPIVVSHYENGILKWCPLNTYWLSGDGCVVGQNQSFKIRVVEVVASVRTTFGVLLDRIGPECELDAGSQMRLSIRNPIGFLADQETVRRHLPHTYEEEMRIMGSGLIRRIEVDGQEVGWSRTQ